MKITIQILLETNEQAGKAPIVEEIFSFERTEQGDKLAPESLGLTLEEAKSLLASVQKKLVSEQVTNYLSQKSNCPQCHKAYQHKGQHKISYSTLFGKLKLDSPRFYRCECQGEHEPEGRPEKDRKRKRTSFSPLADLLPEHTAPEFTYLQTKWAALMSYGLTSQILKEVLPLDKPISTSVLSKKVKQVALRSDSELGEERPIFIEGCQAEWEALPPPAPPLTVGVDGGYVRGREGKDRRFGNFEVIVGKSMPAPGQGPNKRFGYVSCYDTKPKRRLFDLLKSQGMQFNQQVTFLSDGGDTVRDLQLYLNPQDEQILDWFHVAMRLTVLSQFVKGLPSLPEPLVKGKGKGKKVVKEYQEDDLPNPKPEEITKKLEQVKWYLWHGNTYNALQKLDDLEFDLEPVEEKGVVFNKLYLKVVEFKGYIKANQQYIVNYGDRYRNDETISSSFVESTVNEVISKRFVKRQQMRWTKAGAHQLLQVRILVLNKELRTTFGRWYPGMKVEDVKEEQKAVA